MAKNITIAGASYSWVPALEVPLTGGGTTQFLDCVGSQSITQNGTVPVAGLAEVVVNVAAPTTALAITVQPVSITVPADSTATFALDAVGDGLTYQWQWRASSTGTWANSSSSTVGYNTAVLRPVGTLSRSGYQYQCVVSDSHGNSVTSNAVTLTVKSDSGGGLPSGFSAIATGTHTLSSAVAGGSTFTVSHNLGSIPDLFIFWAPSNIATTYSMLSVMRSTQFGWRSTSYLNKAWYHGNSTTTVTGADVTTTYGIKTLTATQATITTYSSSGSYYWRAGTYNWLAIKFG